MTVAVVTGANKGIGFEIAKKLAQAGVKTILACRTENFGFEAENTLKALGLDVKFMQLDISSPASVDSFVASFAQDFESLDILVNNAAIAFKNDDPTPFVQQAKPTMDVNFFSTLNVTTKLLPFLRKSASPRIVNVASGSGHLRIIKSDEKRDIFTSESLTVAALEQHLRDFVHDVESGVHIEKGWPNTCYGMSKLAVIAWTRILARDEPSIKVNACCPGYCDTDMTSHKGPRPAEEGARTPAMLALLPADSNVTGKFYENEAESEW